MKGSRKTYTPLHHRIIPVREGTSLWIRPDSGDRDVHDQASRGGKNPSTSDFWRRNNFYYGQGGDWS